MNLRYTRLPVTALPVDLNALVVHMRTGFSAGTTEATILAECQRLAMTAAAEIEAYADIALTRQMISLIVDADPGEVIDLPVGPLAPDAVVTVDGIPADPLDVEGGYYPRLTLPDGGTALMITYEAGFGDDAASVPADLAHAVMDHAAHLFDLRGAQDGKQGLSIAAARIAARYRGLSI